MLTYLECGQGIPQAAIPHSTLYHPYIDSYLQWDKQFCGLNSQRGLGLPYQIYQRYTVK